MAVCSAVLPDLGKQLHKFVAEHSQRMSGGALAVFLV